MTHPLDLSSPRWSELEHAYGSAAGTPELLRSVLRDPGPKGDYREEPWFSLWSSLCHQGDVYSASFAAMPHVVLAGLGAEMRCAFGVLALPTAVEIARLRHGVLVLPDLAEAYRWAVAQLPNLVARQARHEWDEVFTRVAASAVAASKGHADLAEAIGDLDPETLADFMRDHA